MCVLGALAGVCVCTVCMNMRRKAVKRYIEREKTVKRERERGGRGEKKKRGLGNDCSNHRLQADVLSDTAVNLSVTVCALRSGNKKRLP